MSLPVPGMSCMSPLAPAGDSAVGSLSLSACWTLPASWSKEVSSSSPATGCAPRLEQRGRCRRCSLHALVDDRRPQLRLIVRDLGADAGVLCPDLVVGLALLDLHRGGGASGLLLLLVLMLHL